MISPLSFRRAQLINPEYAITLPRFCKAGTPQVHACGTTLTECRAEFHKNQAVGKKDFGTIEYLLRRGRRQLETYQDPGIKDLH